MLLLYHKKGIIITSKTIRANMGLIILRCVFVLVAAGLSVTFIQTGLKRIIPADSEWMSWAVFGGMMLIALVVIVLDVSKPQKKAGYDHGRLFRFDCRFVS